MLQYQARHSKAIKHLDLANQVLLMLYLFISVNDLLLLPLGALWFKYLILFLVVITLFVGKLLRSKATLFYGFILTSFFLISSIVAFTYSNNIDYAYAENLSLLTALVTPVIVFNWINDNPIKIISISEFFLWSILFATLYKIFYVVYLQGYLPFTFFEIIYKDVAGRGQIEGLDRLNTGNQLLVSFAFFTAFRFFSIGYKNYFMIFVMLVCALNTYLAASRFFTPVTYGLLAIIIFFNVDVKLIWKIFFFVLMAYLSYLLTMDVLAARESFGADDSELIRLIQNKALLQSFFNAPVFGNGPGFYIPELGYDTPWAFENQTLVVFAKYGLVGFSFIAILLFMQSKIFGFAISRFNYFSFLFFIVLASLFNPYLFGTYAAWAFSFLLILAYIYNDANKVKILSDGNYAKNNE